MAHEANHIDNLARRLVAEPEELDVVLVPNLYGDILSDLAAGIIGGLGLMPSGCYGDDYAYFEPPHGIAPDLSGQDAINPTAQILTTAMMLDHLGLDGPQLRCATRSGRCTPTATPSRATRAEPPAPPS